jgi:hypothetical protein
VAVKGTALIVDAKTARVLQGVLNLTQTQQRELMDAWRRYDRGSYEERKHLSESFRAILGPTTTQGCPCCGR